MAPAAFSTFVTTSTNLVVAKPPQLSAEEAVTIPITFLTAHYGLNRLAGMGAGERVLIHAAAGGVGMAAVQLAQRAGAEVFATAGSPHKREFLRSLGVTHVMDSRWLDFADEVMELTGGKGVDIVLNSLTGDFIPKSLSVLGPGGRFIEIGKAGIWEASQVTQFNSDITYHVIYLGDVEEEEPGLIGEMLSELMKEFVAGTLKPLPLRVFPMRMPSMIRYMAMAKHIGKVVVCKKRSRAVPRLPSVPMQATC